MTIIELSVVIIAAVLVVERTFAIIAHVNQTITMKKAFEVISQLQAGISFGAQVGATLGGLGGAIAAGLKDITQTAAGLAQAAKVAPGKPVDLDGAKAAGGRAHHPAGS